MAGVGGAAVPGRLWLAGTEARPTELFSYQKLSHRNLSINRPGRPAYLAIKPLYQKGFGGNWGGV